MPNFQDLPRELRDEIYEYCLSTPRILVAVNERFNPRPPTWPDTEAATALLAVSKAIHAETVPMFYGLNKFELSIYTGDGQRTIFQKYPTLFERIVFNMDLRHLPGTSSDGIYTGSATTMMRNWQTTLSTLTPMSNLKLLQIRLDTFNRYANWPLNLFRDPTTEFLQKIILPLEQSMSRSFPQHLKHMATSRPRDLVPHGLDA